MTAPALPETVTLAEVRAAAREIGRKLYVAPTYAGYPTGRSELTGYTRSLRDLRRQVTLSPLAAFIVDQILEVL
ncbi:MAG TPA: hypothetical protein VFW75_05970 [Acetobacteraceae bacterium]|nr:hypothetical protein [Acetobacteraceae bacterium]